VNIPGDKAGVELCQPSLPLEQVLRTHSALFFSGSLGHRPTSAEGYREAD